MMARGYLAAERRSFGPGVSAKLSSPHADCIDLVSLYEPAATSATPLQPHPCVTEILPIADEMPGLNVAMHNPALAKLAQGFDLLVCPVPRFREHSPPQFDQPVIIRQYPPRVVTLPAQRVQEL